MKSFEMQLRVMLRGKAVSSMGKINFLFACLVGVLNVCLYCYPFLRGASYLTQLNRPPIRMLILADPHLEGDTKIAHMGWRGSLDIWGNDFYLGHIRSSMRFFSRPTHTVFLGDHMSSQWIDDAEFHRRSRRFENRVLQREPGEVIYNITGNHDVGYAGDMTSFRVNRWHDIYGPTNFVDEIVTTSLAPGTPSIRIVGLNDLLLDGPANDEELRSRTLDFVHDLPISNLSTVLLTHVPMHKGVGLCTDQPYVNFYQEPRLLLREQNFLSPESTKAVLNQVFWQTEGIVLTGHDHTGCHILHSGPEELDSFWSAEPFDAKRREELERANVKTIEEVTVRSVMGQYGGNAGLLTARFDHEAGVWRFQYTAVPFVHNTAWWVVHITTLVSILYFLCYVLLTSTGYSQRLQLTLQRIQSRRRRKRKLRTL